MKQFLSFLALTMLLFASFWAIIHPWSSHRVSKLLAKIALVLGLTLLLMGWWTAPAALGKVQFLKEADQWIYQAEQTLPDTGQIPARRNGRSPRLSQWMRTVMGSM